MKNFEQINDGEHLRSIMQEMEDISRGWEEDGKDEGDLRNREKAIIESLKKIEIPEDQIESFQKIAQKFISWADNQEVIDFVAEKAGLPVSSADDLPL
jgi:hypothetical protein